jgi:hypothetical protein
MGTFVEQVADSAQELGGDPEFASPLVEEIVAGIRARASPA